jgi:hypothetical protein
MTASGVLVNTTNGSPTAAPTPNTGNTGYAGQTIRGPIDRAVACNSIGDFTANFDGFLSASNAYNAVDEHFLQGGGTVYFTRDVAADAVSATLNLTGSSGTTLVVTASSPGAWANGAAGGLSITVTVVSATYTITVLRNGVALLTSPVLTSQADAITWSNGLAYANLVASGTPVYIKITVGGGTASNPVAVVAANLAGGSDGSALSSSTLATALARLLPNLGPMQVAAPGYTTTASYNAIKAHVNAVPRRKAELDAPFVLTQDYPTNLSGFTTALAAITAQGDGSRCSMWGSPAYCPGGPSGTQRLIPYSVIQCALSSVSDRQNLPGTPVAGANGQSARVTSLAINYEIEADRDAIKTAGGSVARMRPAAGGGLICVSYEDRAVTLSLPGVNDRSASDARMLMAFAALGQQAAEPFVLTKLNPSNQGALTKDLTAVGRPFYDDGLIGVTKPNGNFQTFAEAWVPNVVLNPAGQDYLATIAVTIARTGEVVFVNIVNEPIGG